MNILGEPFRPYLNTEIRSRQRVHGKLNRTIDDVKYLNSRNAWIKLASGVEIDQYRLNLLKKNNNSMINNASTGKKLAQDYVLFNGTTSLREISEEKYKETVRQGIKSPNAAYGVGNKSFGFSPMPGIVDADISDLNRGSLKRATVNIKVHNRDQLDIIDVLYLRLGYIVLLEWGFDKYLKNEKIVNMGPSLIDTIFFDDKHKESSYVEFLPLIEKHRSDNNGNYDALFGMISNFSWTFQNDGSYNVKMEIMSIGDVIESLKVNVPAQEGTAISYTDSQLLSIKSNPESITQDQFYNISYPGLEGIIQEFQSGEVNLKNNINEINQNLRNGINLEKNVDINTRKTFGQTRKSKNLPGETTLDAVKKAKSTVYSIGASQKISIESTLPQYNIGIGKAPNQQVANTVNSNLKNALEDTILNFFKKGYEGYGSGYSKELTNFIEKLFPDVTFRNNIFGQANEEGRNARNYVLSSALRGNQDNENPLITSNNLKQGVFDYFKSRGIATAPDDVRFTEEDESDLTQGERSIEEFYTTINERQSTNLLTEYFYKIRFLYKPAKNILKDQVIENNVILPDVLAEDVDFKNIEDNEPKIECFGEVIGNPLNPVNGQDILKWTQKVGYPKYSNTDSRVDFIKLKIQPIENSFFIRLGTLLEFIQDEIIPRIEDNKTNPPLVKIDTNIETNICYVIDNAISLDITKCLVRNDTFYTDGAETPNEKIFDNIEPFIVKNKEGMYGKLMNIYFNFSRVEQLFENVDKENNLSLFDLLKSIADDINSALGNVNNLEPTREEGNIIRFIDQTPINNLKNIVTNDNIGLKSYAIDGATLELFAYEGTGENSKSNFIRNVGLTTEITKEYSTMITIGATANGYTPGMEATAFSTWNRGISDRFKRDITAPQDLAKKKEERQNNQEKEQEKLDKRNEEIKKKYYEIIGKKFGLLGLSEENTIYTINSNTITNNRNPIINYYKFAQTIQTKENIINKKDDAVESSVGFLPFNLNITMDGLSGIKIYNRVNVNTKFLPSNYSNTLEFLISGVNHKLSNNDWETSLKTLATSKSTFGNGN